MNLTTEVHCIRCERRGPNRETLQASCITCAEEARLVLMPLPPAPLVITPPRPHFRFFCGKWHCYRSRSLAALVGSGSTPAAAWDHLRLQERIAPPSLLRGWKPLKP